MKINSLSIIQAPNDFLNQISEYVVEVDDSIRNLVSSMLLTIAEAKGVGLSAIQIGVAKRIFVLDTRCEDGIIEVFINPEIVATKGSCKSKEGCLSFLGAKPVEHTLRRYRSVRVKYTNLEGNEITREFTGLTSIVIQHEFEHLQGITFDMAEAGI